MHRALSCGSGQFHAEGPKYGYDVSYNCIRMNSSLSFGSRKQQDIGHNKKNLGSV